MQRNQHILQKSVCLKWIENSKSYSFFFQIKMMVNPWQVDSIEAFACLKCPECVFNTKENKVFQNHAVENHPMSHFLFGTPKSKSDTNIVVLNYDPNDIEKYIKENSNMLEYSLANSTEVSMIKEELSEKTYFVEQVNQINESSKSSFHGQPFTEVLESNFENQTVIDMTNRDKAKRLEEKSSLLALNEVNEGTETYLNEPSLQKITEGTELDFNNQTVIHATNLDKELVFEEKTLLAPKKELFEYHFVDKPSEVAPEDRKIEYSSIENPDERDENIASFDEKTKKFLCTKCDRSFTRKGMVKYHFIKTHKQKGKKRLRCKFCSCRILSQADLDLHILSVHGGKQPECTVCNETFYQEIDLVIHLKEVHDEKMSYSCYICGTKSSSKYNLKLHINSVHEKKRPYKCNLCDYSSSSLSSLNGHMTTHGSSVDERKKSWPCDKCNKGFTKEDGLKKHVEVVHERKRRFKCIECDHNFGYNHELKRHMDVNHAGIRPFNCIDCESSFYTKHELKGHFKKHHEGKDPIDEKKFQCKYCNDKIVSQADLDVHVLSVHKGKKPECPVCNESFSKESYLVIHMKKVHKKKLSYTCHICNVKCARKPNLRLHIQSVHEKKKSFFCNLCDYSSNSLASLNGHMTSTHGPSVDERKKSWPCDKCDKGFTKENGLKRHIEVVHEGKKRFKCIKCDHNFGYNSELKRHMDVGHAGIRPFNCIDCESRFYTKHELKRHFEKHHVGKDPIDEKKFHCKYCNDKIVSQADLDVHVLSVHKGKKPECSVCNESFSKESYLVIHMKKAHKKKLSYTCHICNVKCARKPNLRLHIQSVHEKKKSFFCNLCDYSSSALASLNGHMNSIHGPPGPSIAEKKKAWPCRKCDKGFTTEKGLEKHIEAVHEGKKPYKCTICDHFSSAFKADLKRHTDTIHKKIYPFSCNDCDSSFYTKHELKKHFERNHESKNIVDERKFKPENSNFLIDQKVFEVFDKTVTHEKHIASVDEVKMLFKCNTCDFSSAYNEELKEHISEIHDGLKPKHSDFSAVDSGSTGDARAPLDFVGSEKNTESEIDNLILSAPPGFENPPAALDFFIDHEISEDLKDEFEKKFPLKIALMKHKTAVHEKKSISQCSLCDYTTEFSIDLKNHISSNHGGQKLLKCAICDGEFEVKIKLQKHIESAHGKKVPLDSL